MEYHGPHPAIGDRFPISHGPVGELDRGLRRIQSQRSSFQPRTNTPCAVSNIGVEKLGSDSRKLMLASLGVSFRRTIKIGIVDPTEDITETACSTRNYDFDGFITKTGQVVGALIEEVSPAVCSEDCRSRLAKKMGSLRNLQGVSFRRAKSKLNLMAMEKSGSANLEEDRRDLHEDLHISMRSLADETGTDTLGKLGWNLRRPDTCSSIGKFASGTSVEERTSASETSLENSLDAPNKKEHAGPDDFMKEKEAQEAIEENSEGSMEEFIKPILVINEHPSKFHDRLQLDKVGDIEICRPKKSNAACRRDHVDKKKDNSENQQKKQRNQDIAEHLFLDANVIKNETGIVMLNRKTPSKISGSTPLPSLTADYHFAIPDANIQKSVNPSSSNGPFWPTADGIDLLSKVLVEGQDEYPARRTTGRGKLKRSGSGDSSLGSSFKRMLSFRTFDSKQSFGPEESNRRGIARIRSRLSVRTSIRGLTKHPSAANGATDVNHHAEKGIKNEVEEAVSANKSDAPRGQVAKPEDLVASKTGSRDATFLTTKEHPKWKTRGVAKKAHSLHIDHEVMTIKGASILERKALLSRLARRAVSFPVPSRTQDKTVAYEDDEEELSHDAAAIQSIPDVVVANYDANQDAMSTVSTLGYSAVPGLVECEMLNDASVVSSLGKSKYRTMSSDGGNEVPPVIDCLLAEKLQESLDFSFSGSSI